MLAFIKEYPRTPSSLEGKGGLAKSPPAQHRGPPQKNSGGKFQGTIYLYLSEASTKSGPSNLT